ncbi:hypothetical protein KKF84_14585 [Myxococcota bacterium]|nr:hypothetical protein [Myxococcota bacterium]MBU1536549.1 hypothetical protein [Myxococcota bacterium]
MIHQVILFFKRVGLFLWDPEGSVGLTAGKKVHRALLSPLTLLLLLLVAGILYGKKIAHLTCWTPRFFGVQHMHLLLFSYFLLVYGARRVRRGRSMLLLFGSLTIAILASLPLTLLSFGILIPYWLVVRSSIAPLVKHLTLLALHGAVMVLYSFHLFPGVVFSPLFGEAGVMFAFFLPLRLFWYHYQVSRSHFKGITLTELLTYFFLAPAPFILPYMFALPRREEMLAVNDSDPRTVGTGTLYIAAGLSFYLVYHLLDILVMSLSRVPYMKGILIPWGYPVEPVFWALGSSYMITGLYNRLGAKVTLAFRSPLKSPSVLEWWRRWNVHFRDMLVDMFFYPLVMGKRRHPYLRLWAGVFGVFMVGSTLLHWGVKHYFMNAALVPYWSMLVENAVMFFAVGILLHWEKYRLDRRMELRREAKKEGRRLPPERPRPLVLQILSYPLTYAIVFVSVIGGYTTNLIVEGTYVDRPTAMMRYAKKLRDRGDHSLSRRYYNLAMQDFETRIAPYNDLSSPWRIKERHGALKLALIYVRNNDNDSLMRIAGLLGWSPAMISQAQQRAGYPRVKALVHWELTRLKGMRGVRALFSGKL